MRSRVCSTSAACSEATGGIASSAPRRSRTFGLDAEDFQYRHEETVGALESGRITLDEYLDVTVFCAARAFSRGRIQERSCSRRACRGRTASPWRAISRGPGAVRLATLNNESEELNRHRIELFGLREIFPTFFTSCWLRACASRRAQIYERVLGMTQADPARTLFIDDREQNLAPAKRSASRRCSSRPRRSCATI